jgi:putative sterol carrier protein
MATQDVKKIVDALNARMGAHAGLNGTLKFDFGEIGSVYLDCSATPPVRDGEGAPPAKCTIALTLETFDRLRKGDLDGTSAFMQGKLRVTGDMGLAMKLGPILQKARG